jgi:hypothetical protein
MYKPYKIGTKFGLSDIDTLLSLKDSISPQAYIKVYDMAVKMLEDIQQHWFSGVCLVETCLKPGLIECSLCYGKFCTESCRSKHTCGGKLL